MTKRELEKEVLSLRKDASLLASLVSEIFVQQGLLKSKEPMNQELLWIVNRHKGEPPPSTLERQKSKLPCTSNRGNHFFTNGHCDYCGILYRST